MAAKADIDVFGFDELEKAFTRLKKRYPDDADAMLMAQGQAVRKNAKSYTPVHTGGYPSSKNRSPGTLKKSWRVKKVKLYKGGTVRVVRIHSTDPVAHLVELGHELVSGGKTRERGRTLNTVQRAAKGIKSHGRVEGVEMLGKSIQEARNSFNRDVNTLMDKLIKEYEK